MRFGYSNSNRVMLQFTQEEYQKLHELIGMNADKMHLRVKPAAVQPANGFALQVFLDTFGSWPYKSSNAVQSGDKYVYRAEIMNVRLPLIPHMRITECDYRFTDGGIAIIVDHRDVKAPLHDGNRQQKTVVNKKRDIVGKPIATYNPPVADKDKLVAAIHLINDAKKRFGDALKLNISEDGTLVGSINISLS